MSGTTLVTDPRSVNPGVDLSETQDLKHSPDDSEDEDSVYYFESDHLALKGNKDYRAMLKTISLLEAQRIQAFKDIESLQEAQDAALKDPIAFVARLQRGQDLNLPRPQKLASLPDIKWEKYTAAGAFTALNKNKHMTRLKIHQNSCSDGAQTAGDDEGADLMDSISATHASSLSQVVVRGRIKDPAKSRTFNQLWTTEEQRRLEQLLLDYPPEEVEARRWAKIATALGNRTPQQVASRIQKYFLKLAKARLPVPGRQPNLSTSLTNKKTGHRHHRYQRLYQPRSTFLTSYTPPVYMSDEDGDDAFSYGTADSVGDPESRRASPTFDDAALVSDEDGISDDLHDTDEYKELLQLKQMRRDLTQEHTAYQCDSCQCDPIVGIRWHCTDCPQETTSVDLCLTCMDRDLPFETVTHNSSHRMEPVKLEPLSTKIDTDYTCFQSHDYNYLDSNYMPAT